MPDLLLVTNDARSVGNALSRARCAFVAITLRAKRHIPQELHGSFSPNRITAMGARIHPKGDTAMIKTLTTASLALAALVGASLASTTTASAGGYGYGYSNHYGYSSGYVSTYEPVCYIKKIRVHTYYGWKIKKVRVCE
jgi:hypothetical protein